MPMNYPEDYSLQFYRDFQLIAYEIPTLDPVAAGNKLPAAVDRLPINEKLLGENKKLSNDAKFRLRQLAGVIDLADKELSKLIDLGKVIDSKTLKVFMAPEFYFRPNTGPGKSYSQDSMSQLLLVLRGLFVHEDFRDWLFVPGTIFWNFPAPKQKGEKVYYNTAVMIKGGAGKAESTPFHYVHKRKASSIDISGLSIGKINEGLKIYLKECLGDWNERKDNITTFDNVGMGIEICLDHHYHVLQDVYKEYPEHGLNQPILKLHLLTACGQRVWSQKVAVDPNRHLLRVDGSPSKNSKPHSQVSCMTNEKTKGGTPKLAGYKAVGEPLAIPLELQRTTNKEYKEQLVFYPQIRL